MERQFSLSVAQASVCGTPGHFPGQKLRLGGDALAADPTYLLYLAYRSRGELRRIDFAAWPRTATCRLKLSPESARKPPVCRSGISRAASFDLEVTSWAPTRLTSCIFHSGHTEAYEPLRSTRSSACAPFRDLATPESTRKRQCVVFRPPGAGIADELR